MGSFLDRPKTEKETQIDRGHGLTVAMSAMQGWRVEMEDAHTVVMDVDGTDRISFFAVFDGHGGSLVSTHSATHILNKITSAPEWKADHVTPESLGNSMVRGFLEMDDDLRKLPEVVRGDDHSGSTAIAAFVTPTHVIVANCGDSRSMLVRGNTAVEMSSDHKPYNEGEQRRIEKAGGSVTMRRVNGDLAVSRALGDFVYKHMVDLPATAQQVSAEPEIKTVERTAADQFLVLACDGIWDVMSNQDVADFVVRAMGAITDRPITTADLGKVAESLIDDCLVKGSRDNMSVILVAFPGATSSPIVASATAPLPSIGAGAGTGGGGGATASSMDADSSK